MNLHQYAIYIEQRVRNMIGKNIDRYALGGILDADFIEYGGLVTVICAGMAKYYFGENMEIIDSYLEEISEYNGVSFNDIGEDKVIELFEKFKETMTYIKLGD